jgi:hypothetical protein
MGRFRSSSLPDLDFRAAEHHDGLIRYQIEAVIAAAREELHPRVGLPRIGLEIEREFAERRADLLLRCVIRFTESRQRNVRTSIGSRFRGPQPVASGGVAPFSNYCWRRPTIRG